VIVLSVVLRSLALDFLVIHALHGCGQVGNNLTNSFLDFVLGDPLFFRRFEAALSKLSRLGVVASELAWDAVLACYDE